MRACSTLMQVTVFCVCDVDQGCNIFQKVFSYDIQAHGVMGLCAISYKFCLHLILVGKTLNSAKSFWHSCKKTVCCFIRILLAHMVSVLLKILCNVIDSYPRWHYRHTYVCDFGQRLAHLIHLYMPLWKSPFQMKTGIIHCLNKLKQWLIPAFISFKLWSLEGV